MKAKHILILFLIFLALGGILAVKNLCFRPKVEASEYTGIKLAPDAKAVSKIEFMSPSKKQFVIEKSNETWVILSKWDAPVSEEKARAFFKDMASVNCELRSNDKALLGDYGIGDGEAYGITFFDNAGKASQKIFIGAKRSVIGGTFVRKSGANDVYLADKDIFNEIGIYGDPASADIDIRQWADMSLAKIEADKVNAVRLEKQKNVIFDLILEADKTGNAPKWDTAKHDSPSPLDPGKVKAFIQSLAALKGQDIFDPAGGKYGFTEPYMKFLLKNLDNSSVEVMIGGYNDEKAKTRYARSAAAQVFSVPEYALPPADSDISKFFADKPPAQNAAKK